jgi:hypothetical protein
MAGYGVNLHAYLWTHREGIGGGIVAVLSFIVDPPARVVRIRRVVLSLLRRRPVQSTNPGIPDNSTKGNSMSIFASFEKKLHDAAAAFTSHQNIETLKTDLSAVLGLFAPVIHLGVRAAAPIAAEAAAKAVQSAVGGDLGAALGTVASEAITAESAKIDASVAPAPVVE